jgi:predicted ATPase
LNFYIQTPPTAREQVLNFLRNQRSLLVLDNTEQIPKAASVVQALLGAAPDLKCLVTTRRALQLRGERQVEVPPMPLETACQLFVARAQERRTDFELTPENTADVIELCRRLEGVPLALELAASRIGLSSPREILQRLDQRFRLLQTRSPDLPDRQRALRGTIDWSYELLGEEDRTLFAELAAFARGFTAEAAEAVCDAFDVFDGLQELQSQSLLRAEMDAATQQTHFLMLEAVREYAAEKLQELPDQGHEVRLRHAQYFLRFAQERLAKLRTFKEMEALRELTAGFDNVVAAMDWAQSGGEAELCAQLALVIAHYLARAGFQNEAARRLDIGQDALRRLPAAPAHLRAELLRERAGLHHDAMEAAATRQCATEALALFEELGERQGMANCHNLLALAGRDDKDFAAAREHLDLALQAFEQLNDQSGMARVHTNFGVVCLEDPDGSEDKATEHLQRALSLCSQSGDRRGHAEVSNNLGLLAWQQGDMETAWRYYSESLAIEQELGHVFGAGRSLFNLGEVAEAQEKWQQAVRSFAAAEVLFTKVGSPYLPYAIESLESVAGRQEMDAEAQAALRHLSREKTLDELIEWTMAPEA